MDLTDIFRTSHTNAEEYTFSSAHGTFSRIDHILDHTSNLTKSRKIEFISSIFSDHNTMRLDISYRESNCKKKKKQTTNTWRLYNTFLNNEQVTEKSKGKSKNS